MLRTCSKCSEDKPVEAFTPMSGKRANNRTSTCTPCRTNYNKLRRARNPEHVYNIERRSKFKSQYGITLEEYDVMLKHQGGTCAICKVDKPSGRTTHFAVDHCHVTGVVRGLLCTKCNRGLGLFNDDTTRIEQAIKYLKGTVK